MNRLAKLLTGEGAHAPFPRLLEDLGAARAGERPGNAPHSIFEVLWHMDWWQRWMLERATGARPEVPSRAAATWPERSAPADEGAWLALATRFLADLERARALAADAEARARPLDERTTVGDVLEGLLAHNAHHAGQLVLLRQLLGAWPPPGGGDTW